MSNTDEQSVSSNQDTIEALCRDREVLTGLLEDIFYEVGKFFLKSKSNKIIENKEINKELLDRLIQIHRERILDRNSTKEEIEKILLEHEKDFEKLIWTSLGSNVGKKNNKIEELAELLANKELKNILIELSRIKSLDELRNYLDKKLFYIISNIKDAWKISLQVLSIWLSFSNPDLIAPISLSEIYIDDFKNIIRKCFSYEKIYNNNIKEIIKKDKNKIKMYYTVYLVAINKAKERLSSELGLNLAALELYLYLTLCRRYSKKDPYKRIGYDNVRKCKNNVEEIIYRYASSIRGKIDIDTVDPRLIGEIEGLLSKFGQIIMFGPPGTGKTFLANHYLRANSSHSHGLGEFVTFHKSYGYEEFIEGIWPVVEGHIVKYEVKDGVFKELAIRAIYNAISNNKSGTGRCSLNGKTKGGKAPSYEEIKRRVQDCLKSIRDGNESIDPEVFKEASKYILVIDEINRGDISRIFGELITLLEYDKRLSRPNQIIGKLPYSGDLLAIPPNLYIIGTMNSTDRSIALVDYALRRRFAFVELSPQPDLLRDKVVGSLSLKDLLEKINEKIRQELGRDFEIGHSYFLNVNDKESLHSTWYYQIVPLLHEYFYTSPEALERIFNNIEKLYNTSQANNVSPEELVDMLTNWIKTSEV